MKSHYFKDFLSSLVVFLVALPLCLGIALASGTPPFVGLIAGIVGGIVVGFIGGSPLQVSGPAAGLAVIVFGIVQKEGLQGLAMICLLAGVIQIIAALLKAGHFFRAISPAVIKGMLGGIGVLIFSSQFHVLLDDVPKKNGIQNLITIPQAFLSVFDVSQGNTHVIAGVLGLTTIFLIISFNYLSEKLKVFLPAPLLAILATTLLTYFGGLPINLVEIPSSFMAGINEYALWNQPFTFKSSYILEALVVAFIATTETLLCVTAVDKLKPGHESDYNKELLGQGLGNTICGFLGGMPITGVIVRSAANVESGAVTKWSAFFHGIWILLALSLVPELINLIPTAGLAAILVFTGFKLVDYKLFAKLWKEERSEALIFLATIVGIVTTDLLKGVLLGLALSLVKLLWKLHQINIHQDESNSSERETKLSITGHASFLSIPKLSQEMEKAKEKGKPVVVDLSNIQYIDQSVEELVKGWEEQAKDSNIQIQILHKKSS